MACCGSAGSTTTLGSLFGNGSSQSRFTFAAVVGPTVHSWTDGAFGGVFELTKGLASSSAGSVARARPLPVEAASVMASRTMRRRRMADPVRPVETWPEATLAGRAPPEPTSLHHRAATERARLAGQLAHGDDGRDRQRSVDVRVRLVPTG